MTVVLETRYNYWVNDRIKAADPRYGCWGAYMEMDTDNKLVPEYNCNNCKNKW